MAGNGWVVEPVDQQRGRVERLLEGHRLGVLVDCREAHDLSAAAQLNVIRDDFAVNS